MQNGLINFVKPLFVVVRLIAIRISLLIIWLRKCGFGRVTGNFRTLHELDLNLVPLTSEVENSAFRKAAEKVHCCIRNEDFSKLGSI